MLKNFAQFELIKSIFVCGNLPKGKIVKYIGIAAYSGTPSETLIEGAKEFMARLAVRVDRDRIVLVLGGYWGLMKYVVDEALDLGFKVVIIPPESMEDVNFPEDAIVIKTGTSFRVRSVFLVRTSDVLIALGGASGSIQEVVTAYTEGKDVFILGGSGMPTDRLSFFSPYIDDRKTSKITIINNPRELADRVIESISR